MTLAFCAGPVRAWTAAIVVCASSLTLGSRDAYCQDKPTRRVFDLPAFAATGEAPRSTDLPGFTAVGAAARVTDLPEFSAVGAAAHIVHLPGFVAVGAEIRIFDLPGFRASGVAADSSRQTMPVRAPRTLGCDGGCFEATGSNDERSISMHGPAVVTGDDGSRFQIVLGKMETNATYLSFARDPGGPPRIGTYVLADLCSEQTGLGRAAPFSAEFVSRAYEAEAESYLSTGGTLVIESVADGRFIGRFNVMACRFDTEGKRHAVRISGTFNAVK